MSRETEAFFLNVLSRTNILKKWTDTSFLLRMVAAIIIVTAFSKMVKLIHLLSTFGSMKSLKLIMWQKDIKDAIIKYYNDEI